MKLRLASSIKLLLCICTSLWGCFVVGCTENDYYSFGFDLRKDGQHAAIQSYEYLAGKHVLVKGAPEDFANFHGILLESRSLPAKGTLLHVKWKDTLTGKEYEESISTMQYLPKKMSGKALSLMIQDNHLELFITDMRSPPEPNVVVVGPSFMSGHTSVQIYPARDH